jgi:hypothetical protein
MRFLTAVLILAMVDPASAQKGPPIIDMHLHALPADANGPPPLGLCAPFPEYPLASFSDEWGMTFIAWQKKPPCRNPVWSPQTDQELMQQTITMMDRRNVFGVLSGKPDRVRQWMEAAPGRFNPGLQFQLGRDALSPAELRGMHQARQFAVLAEVTNQYVGIGPSDPQFEPYLAVAEELDIPVGIHVGVGPPGAPYLGPISTGRLFTAL